MTPKKDGQTEYTDLCLGLERMASLYKNKRLAGAPGKKNDPGRLFHIIRRIGLKEALRRWKIQRSGVDDWLTSGKQTAVAEAGERQERNYFSSERIAVYTAEFGVYDDVLDPVIKPDNIDYYLITDSGRSSDSCWKVLDPQDCIPGDYQRDPLLANRWCKMHPHELFPGYQYSVYIDANYLIVSDFTELVNRMNEYPIAMFKHKNRQCVYEEVKACMIKKKAGRKALQNHSDLLRQHGVPENYGLLEATVIVRRHHEPVCREIMDHWWKAFLNGSGRDQIALIDALWGLQIQPEQLGALGSNLYLCNLFVGMAHKQRIKGQLPVMRG